jgi:tRNA A-37 threonylcarbamoyl transferase component Bud32
MTTDSICPKCSAPIGEGSPQGLCPKCVLLAAATNAGAVKLRSKEPQAALPQEIAPHFPELEVLELIGVGGMGAVYKARQIKLGRLVALKVLANSLAGDPEFLERFDREARVLGRLNHPGIVTVFDSGMAGPCAYLIMEFVDGVNLRQAMQAGGFKPSEALAVTQEICSALEYAHGQGILHRDIKPENILIDSNGRVKIADFGIAKLIGDQGPDHATLTMRGAVLGSMSYMAPEQFDAPGDVDQRADIYSLGVVLYELLTGELPRGRFGPPSEKSAVDARIDEIVMRTLEREREARFQSVHQMKTQVDAAHHSSIDGIAEKHSARTLGHSPTARRATASAVCTGISLVLALAAFTYIAMINEIARTHVIIPGAFYLILVLSALGVGVPAILGIAFGAGVLGEVRRSAGKKRGFLRGMFSTTTWPALLSATMIGIVVVTSIVAKTPFAGRNTLLVLGCLLLLAGGLGIVFIRRLACWTKQDPATPKMQTHMWRFMAATFVALICLVSTLLSDPVFNLSKLMPGAVSVAPIKGPLVEFKTSVPAGMAATFRLLRVVVNGGETQVGASGSMIAPDGEPLGVTLRYSQTGMMNSGRAVGWQIVTDCEKIGQRISTTTEFSGHWQFLKNDQREYFLQKSQILRIKLASSLIDGASEALYIEIVTAPRPELPNPGPAPLAGLKFALQKGVIGFDTPTALLHKASIEQARVHE